MSPAPLILVVDDCEPLRFAIAEALRSEGYRVEEANDGAEALGACFAEPPWLVITDCDMPRITGSELVAYLSADEALRETPSS